MNRSAGSSTLLTVLLLAFDTATPATTAAVHDGQRALAETVTVDARRHGELLMPSITGVLGPGRRRPGTT